MAWIIGIGVCVLVVAFFLRNMITGVLMSPRSSGIYYLSDTLKKQFGIPHGTISGVVLGELVDMQLKLAEYDGRKGSLGTKKFLVERIPFLAMLVSQWIEDDPRLDQSWRSVFAGIGVPQRKNMK
ncbi:MAG: hypothetical protein ACLQJ0_04960 [Steroidobacteraceae bacterium]